MATITLCDLIAVVPQVGDVCSAILNGASHYPGSGAGVKRMRLVNKRLSIIMLRSVQRYTLMLDMKPIVVKEMVLLARTRLSCLRVVVWEDYDGRLC